MSRIAFEPKSAPEDAAARLLRVSPVGTALPGAESSPSAEADLLREAQRKLKLQWGPDSSERLALLGIILGRLEDVSFEEAAALLGLKGPRLEKWMRGEEAISASYVARWRLLAEILENLHSVLKPNATGKWLRQPIQGLSHRTPLDEIVAGRLERVRAVTEKYRDASFS